MMKREDVGVDEGREGGVVDKRKMKSRMRIRT